MKHRLIRTETVLLALMLLCAATLLRPPAVETVNGYFGAPQYRGRDDLPYAALMVNVYSGAEYVAQMLDILSEEDVRATFFIGGLWARENGALIARMAAEGHELGNHGTMHKQHSALSMEENIAEIEECAALVRDACGVHTRLFAPPSGDFSRTTLEAARRLGYETILWTADTIDWRDQDVALLTARVEKKICTGAFVLTHPTEATVRALPRILQIAREKDLGWRTVGELLDID